MCNDTPDTPQKQCTKCGEWKPATPEYWYRLKTMPDGLQTQCKDCMKAYDKWRKEHPEEFEAQKQRKKELFNAGLQQCSICGEIKPFDEFHPGGNKKSGRRSACRVCTSAQMGCEHTDRKRYPDAPEGYKYCRKCDELKPLDEFYDIGTNHCRDGKSSWCAECEVKDAEKYRRKKGMKPREKLPEGYKRCCSCKQVLKANTDNFPPHSDGKYGIHAYCRRCFRDYCNQSVQKQRKREYYESIRVTASYKKGAIVRAARRRARLLELKDDFTVHQRDTMMEYWNHVCAYCGAQQSFWYPIEIDHYVPITSDNCTGTTATNMLPACKQCNASKNDNGPEEWLISKFGQRKAKQILDRIHTYFEWVKD